MPNNDQPTLQNWNVQAGRRLVGAVYNRPGHSNGHTIVTSPVVQVRFLGDSKTPVAFTASGSAYWLGEPSESLGIDRAEAFVYELSKDDPHRTQPPPDPLESTVILKVR